MTDHAYTRNETLALMHEDSAYSLKAIADHIEKWQMERDEIVRLIREIADAKDAQSVVCRLRDEINSG